MPDTASPTVGSAPSPEELAEILANLDFFREMEDAETLPLEEVDDDAKEESHE